MDSSLSIGYAAAKVRTTGPVSARCKHRLESERCSASSSTSLSCWSIVIHMKGSNALPTIVGCLRIPVVQCCATTDAVAAVRLHTIITVLSNSIHCPPQWPFSSHCLTHTLCQNLLSGVLTIGSQDQHAAQHDKNCRFQHHCYTEVARLAVNWIIWKVLYLSTLIGALLVIHSLVSNCCTGQIRMCMYQVSYLMHASVI